jgi:hypothetical protein
MFNQHQENHECQRDLCKNFGNEKECNVCVRSIFRDQINIQLVDNFETI